MRSQSLKWSVADQSDFTHSSGAGSFLRAILRSYPGHDRVDDPAPELDAGTTCLSPNSS